MAMTIAQLRKVRELATEVANLTIDIENEIDSETEWSPEFVKRIKRYPSGPPSDARLITGSRITGELRRRSMDLTRALAELRRS